MEEDQRRREKNMEKKIDEAEDEKIIIERLNAEQNW